MLLEPFADLEQQSLVLAEGQSQIFVSSGSCLLEKTRTGNTDYAILIKKMQSTSVVVRHRLAISISPVLLLRLELRHVEHDKKTALGHPHRKIQLARNELLQQNISISLQPLGFFPAVLVLGSCKMLKTKFDAFL